MGEIKVLAFDTFGTVVDWYGGVTAEVARVAPHVDADKFVRAWRASYFRMTRECVESGQWRVVDDLHRDALDELAPSFDLGLDEAALDDLNLAWHRLDPWPDSIGGLTRLRERFTITPLSNGGIALLTNMAKRAGLPWDLILSAEVFHAYKPDERAYLGTAEVLRVRPDEVMMVAAHHPDLDAAQAAGLHTAYIERPMENGPRRPKDTSPSPKHPLHFTDIEALADHLLK